MADSTARFSSRASSYAAHRPGYPPAVLATLVSGCGLTRATEIADVGAGTGIFTEILLQHGNPVAAVEPNREMRDQLHRLQRSFPALRVVDGTAAATTLDDGSVGLVVVAQAFHWFDPILTRREFARILRPDGWVGLVWNQRDKQSTAFLREYDATLLEFSPEYRGLQHGPVDLPVLDEFFGPAGYSTHAFANVYAFDFERLRGLIESTSYVPGPADPAFTPMMKRLGESFAAHQAGGVIEMRYATRLFVGQLRD